MSEQHKDNVIADLHEQVRGWREDWEKAESERDAALERIKQLREALHFNRLCVPLADPGRFVKRLNDYTEPLYQWQARAVIQAIADIETVHARAQLEPEPPTRESE